MGNCVSAITRKDNKKDKKTIEKRNDEDEARPKSLAIQRSTEKDKQHIHDGNVHEDSREKDRDRPSMVSAGE